MAPRAAVKEQAQEARARTAEAAARKRRLVSIYGRHVVQLRTAVEGRDHLGKTYVIERPITLKFNDHTCLVEPEQVELVENHPAYTGIGTPKLIAWEGDPLIPFNKEIGIRTIRGAIGTVPAAAQPPVENWDGLEPDTIRDLINLGSVPLRRAIVWEGSHRARPAVLMDLSEALGRGEAGAAEEPLGDEVTVSVASPETWGPPPGADTATEGMPH
jgi:hypothetical protein